MFDGLSYEFKDPHAQNNWLAEYSYTPTRLARAILGVQEKGDLLTAKYVGQDKPFGVETTKWFIDNWSKLPPDVQEVANLKFSAL